MIKQLLKKYEEDFNRYANRRIYECPSEIAIGSNSDALLRMKLDSKYDNFSLRALQDFQATLCKILNSSEEALVLRRIDEGCVELTFRVPVFVLSTIFPLAANQENALIRLGVLSLSSITCHFSAEDHQVIISMVLLSYSFFYNNYTVVFWFAGRK